MHIDSQLVRRYRKYAACVFIHTHIQGVVSVFFLVAATNGVQGCTREIGYMPRGTNEALRQGDL